MSQRHGNSATLTIHSSGLRRLERVQDLDSHLLHRPDQTIKGTGDLPTAPRIKREYQFLGVVL